MTSSTIRDLALIGDRRSAAAVNKKGAICWYCPGRFDEPTLFASLLDDDAGEWTLDIPGVETTSRHYLEQSAILETLLHTANGTWSVFDWMPIDSDSSSRLCRKLDVAPVDARVEMSPQPNYATSPPHLQIQTNNVFGSSIVINGLYCVHASVPATVKGGRIRYDIREGSTAWFVLAGTDQQRPCPADLQTWYRATLSYWKDLNNRSPYRGPYEQAVKDSLRALRLLSHRDTGGIVAAATFGLPEVPGGGRNYDYRYVWLRDAAMIVSALTRAGSDGMEERHFLGFLCSARRNHDGKMPLPPFVTLDGNPAPAPASLPWQGYAESRPVIIGNVAGQQLQLDGLANVLLAAKLIYRAQHLREHWAVVSEIADYLTEHWHEPDHGIWEEGAVHQYTASKVVTAVALRFIAEHADDPERAARWRAAAGDINAYVAQHCLTTDGAYAAVAGGNAVDLSAVLFPVWDFCAPDTPEMLATIARLEDESSEGKLLYRRHLECDDAAAEGIFLAGTLWVAQYWIMRDDLQRAGSILDAALDFANDLGLFAEEGSSAEQGMLGNFPQSFVHAALIGAVVDYRNALTELSPNVTKHPSSF